MATILHILLLGIFLLEVKVQVSQSCPTLCDPMDYTAHGILQARILKWVAFPFSRGSSQPRGWTQISCIAGRFFNQLSHQGRPRILEWVAYSFSSRSFWPRNWTGVSCIAGGFFTSWATREAILVISFKQPTHWKSPWFWERLRAEGEEDVRGWDGWMASLM